MQLINSSLNLLFWLFIIKTNIKLYYNYFKDFVKKIDYFILTLKAHDNWQQKVDKILTNKITCNCQTSWLPPTELISGILISVSGYCVEILQIVKKKFIDVWKVHSFITLTIKCFITFSPYYACMAYMGLWRYV